MASQLGVTDRVRFAGRVADDGLIDLLGRCRAVCFPAYQEDYGFVTVEAFASRKAVVTCRDSGGPAELVADGVNGFVCDPSPEALARALTSLVEDSGLAERLGQHAFETGAKLTWPDTVRQLVLE
jgi:glycosyltransferase involved in cell wall biosynthesis